MNHQTYKTHFKMLNSFQNFMNKVVRGDHSGMDFRWSAFDGAKLKGKFVGANFTNATFIGTDLSEAELADADFTKAYFSSDVKMELPNRIKTFNGETAVAIMNTDGKFKVFFHNFGGTIQEFKAVFCDEADYLLWADELAKHENNQL